MRSLHTIATTIAICLVFLSGSLSHAGEDTRDWRFVDISGKEHAPFGSDKTKALVAVFISTDCPVANYFQPTLREMAEKYAARGVRFVLLHPDPEITAAAAKKHAKEYSITIPVALDPEQKMAKRLEAEFTPEVFVIDPQGAVRYRGRINDMYVGYGKKRRAPSHNDLDDAITALLTGKKIANPKTQPVGCHIFYPDTAGAAAADPKTKSKSKAK
jgi:thiol-disulfide isomerase/thioredoxin